MMIMCEKICVRFNFVTIPVTNTFYIGKALDLSFVKRTVYTTRRSYILSVRAPTV